VSAAAASAVVAPAPSVAASAPATVARPSDSGGNETILSVLPARAQRGPARAASAPTPVTAARNPDTPPPRSAPIDAAAPRVADATAGRTPKPVAAAESTDPRARCGERNFFSMLVCLKRECQNPALSAHAECVKLREQEASHRSGENR
jgi:hypothetical protein